MLSSALVSLLSLDWVKPSASSEGVEGGHRGRRGCPYQASAFGFLGALTCSGMCVALTPTLWRHQSAVATFFHTAGQMDPSLMPK